MRRIAIYVLLFAGCWLCGVDNSQGQSAFFPGSIEVVFKPDVKHDEINKVFLWYGIQITGWDSKVVPRAIRTTPQGIPQWIQKYLEYGGKADHWRVEVEPGTEHFWVNEFVSLPVVAKADIEKLYLASTTPPPIETLPEPESVSKTLPLSPKNSKAVFGVVEHVLREEFKQQQGAQIMEAQSDPNMVPAEGFRQYLVRHIRGFVTQVPPFWENLTINILVRFEARDRVGVEIHGFSGTGILGPPPDDDFKPLRSEYFEALHNRANVIHADIEQALIALH